MKYKLDIDKNNLDVECERHSHIFGKCAEEYVIAVDTRDTLKDMLELARSDIDSRIRTNPEKYGIEKLTEAAIQNKIIAHPKYKKANEKYLKAKLEANIILAGKEALEHRKQMLTNLVKLYEGEYFSVTSPTKNLSEEGMRKHKKEQERMLKEEGRVKKK